MKKIFAMFAIATISFAFVACGGGEKSSELDKQAKYYGTLRAVYHFYDADLYDAFYEETKQWIDANGGSKTEDLMYEYYDAVYEQVEKMWDNEVSMNDAIKQLGY